ncbi:alpha-galactosidase [Plantibacter sp. Mn2098]|uniref:alpha-galactosidase n=1 Tax=Plantibacter sp. Mn2098 TaxID=3395266 RepID=UPI003BE8EBA8
MSSDEFTLNHLWTPGDPAVDWERVATAHDLDLNARVFASAGVDVSARRDDRGNVALTVMAAGTVALAIVVSAGDSTAWWSPADALGHMSIPALWGGRREVSAFGGVASGALISRGDRARMAFRLDSGHLPVVVRAGIIEETAEFAVLLTVRGTGRLELRVDASERHWTEAISSVGPPVAIAALGAEEPVYCTWYAAHQDLDQEDLLAQVRIAGELGMGTLIVDDGWQTSERGRGYRSAGDWIVSRNKFPDPARFVEETAQAGLQTMWWISTPFLGFDAIAHADDLATIDTDEALGTSVLDPRDETVRSSLVSRLRSLLATTGAVGFKLDFLERWDSQDASIPEAALSLLAEIAEMVDEVAGTGLIEYRDPYIGYPTTRSASMIRVGDCPLRPAQNRAGIVDLRLTAPGVPVHSDPVMWSPDDSVGRVAQHLQNALFGVPQISLRLTDLSEPHRAVLAFWLGFWRQHRDIILHGDFRPQRPDLQYPIVGAERDGTRLVGRFAPVPIDLSGAWETCHVLNADDAAVVLDVPDRLRVRATVRDARGDLISEVDADWSGLVRMQIPTGGLLTVERRSVAA